MKSNKNITFLTSSINYPSYIKRIIAIHNLGVQSKVLAFEIDLFYPHSNLPMGFKSLGSIQQESYLSRIKPMLTAIPDIRKEIKNADVVYVFGFDIVLLTVLALCFLKNKPKLIYEIHDIREVLMGKGILGKGMRILEKYIMTNVDLLIATSNAYITGYYEGMLRLKNIRHIVLENKLHYNDIKAPISPPRMYHKPLRIGYFGSLRCNYAWETIKQVVQRSKGGIEVYVRGVPKGLGSFKADIKSISGIEYGGPYLDPDDLSEIYGKIDIVWIAGYQKKTSFHWSRSCRFYYACYFKRPMIALWNTEDGRDVDKLKVGLCIKLEDTSSAVEKVLNITSSEFAKWQRNIINLPKNIHTYTDEYNRLLKAISELSDDK